MKKHIVIIAVLLVVSIGATALLGNEINATKTDVTITENVIFGDKTVAYGLIVSEISQYDDHLFWDTEYRIDAKPYLNTNYTFYSSEKYYDLLGKAEQVLELAACSKEEDSSQGYADASDIMLCHTDVLIALWDGKVTKYKAGTYATLRAARKAHLPVIVIRTDSPEAPVTYYSYAEEHADWQEHLLQLSQMLQQL